MPGNPLRIERNALQRRRTKHMQAAFCQGNSTSPSDRLRAARTAIAAGPGLIQDWWNFVALRLEMRPLLTLAALFALASQTASAGTLDRIRETGVFRIGYRADARPYSYQARDGQPAGYIVDLCSEVAAALGPNIHPQYVRVPADRRFEAVRDGHVDVLCDPSSA